MPLTIPPPPFAPHNQLLAISIGNSIGAQAKHNASGYWEPTAALWWANAFSGGAMRFKRVTATTRMDEYGVYGYSGQTLPTILADLQVQVFDNLRGITVPDLVIGSALLENDIAGGATVAAMQASLKTFLRTVQYRWPGAIVILCTPRPSFSYDTAGKVSAYQGIRDYILGLDNSHTIFASRMDGYENPASPGTPLGTSGAPIYTDSSVHPNSKGAMINGRALAATLLRISAAWKSPFDVMSTNMPLSGSGAASGTNVSGTVPTSTTVSGSSNGTYVAAAEAPGLLQTVTVASKGSEPPYDLSTFNFGALSLSDVTQISPFIVYEIVSGASAIRSLELWPRVNDGGGNNFQKFVTDQTNYAEPDYQNGDILTLRCPPLIAASDSISACTVYGKLWTKLAGGTPSFRVLAQGVEIVA